MVLKNCIMYDLNIKIPLLSYYSRYIYTYTDSIISEDFFCCYYYCCCCCCCCCCYCYCCCCCCYCYCRKFNNSHFVKAAWTLIPLDFKHPVEYGNDSKVNIFLSNINFFEYYFLQMLLIFYEL